MANVELNVDGKWEQTANLVRCVEIRPISIYQNSVPNKRHNLQALGNKYKDLYEFIPHSLEMMPFVLG